jgi:CheY-like chemotaxis protein
MATPHALLAKTPPARPTILCIDDDARMLEFYEAVLDPRGYRTLTVTNGLQGLALAQQDRPDVILLDVMLAGLSGFDICRKFRADDGLRTIPIILITGMEPPSGGPTRPEVRADVILRKPVDPAHLLATIQRVLGEPSAPPGPGATDGRGGSELQHGIDPENEHKGTANVDGSAP